MKGDFTRGHQPDRKRSRTYRRVLHQQGRVLLDSDVAALVDAQDHLHRLTLAGLGCAHGSPNYGFLITPGKLYALFEHTEGITATGDVTFYRDYEKKYLDRYPSIRVAGGVAGGTISIPLITPILSTATGLAIWTGPSDDPVNVVISSGLSASVTFSVTSIDDTFERKAVPITPTGDLATLTLNIPANAIFWIALVEDGDADDSYLWAAGGRAGDPSPGWYAIEGLVAELAEATAYPEVSYPGGAGEAETDLSDLASAGRWVVAYLEIWERLMTAVEDPGIRENALGNGLDTSVRTEALGQVKFLVLELADYPDAASAEAAARAAFANVQAPQSSLAVDLTSATFDPDPCALPTLDGYTGTDNRLYRFEVQDGGALGTATLKWSRDNGSHLFAVEEADDGDNELVFLPDSGVEDGDLVELLGDEIDLGDEIASDGLTGRATITGGAFVPATRRVGQLVQLRFVDVDTNGNERFSLVDLDGAAVTVFTDVWPYAASALTRVRRWHGRIVTEAATTEYEIENGVTVTLGGTFRPGEWWISEARVSTPNENGTPSTSPHGPERLFEPLALLQWVNAGGVRLNLEAWLDERYSSLCELDADDIAFDGEKYGESADTVQEIIDVLLSRTAEGCCEVTVLASETGDDDAARIAAAIAEELPDGGVVCLKDGPYTFKSTLEIDRPITLRGCPDAVISVQGGVNAFHVSSGARLQIEDIVVHATSGLAPRSIVVMEPTPDSHFAARRAGLLLGAATPGFPTIRVNDAWTPAFPTQSDVGPTLDLSTGFAVTTRGPTVTLVDSTVMGDWCLGGNFFDRVEITGTALYGVRGAVNVGGAQRLELRTSTLVTGLSSSFVDGLPTSALLVDAESAVAGATTTIPANNTAALRCDTIPSGVVEGCSFGADVGVFWSRAQDLRLAGNRYLTGGAAVRGQQSLRVRVESERVDGDAIGLHFPRAARRLQVTDNEVEASRGIVLGAILDGTMLVAPDDRQEIWECAISDNLVGFNNRGIVVAMSGSAATAIRVEEVDVTDNIVRTQDGVAGISTYSVPTTGGGVRILDNNVQGPITGIGLAGWSCEARGNALVVTYAGVVVNDAAESTLVIANRISAPDRKGVTGVLGRNLFGIRVVDNDIDLDSGIGVDITSQTNARVAVSRNRCPASSLALTGGQDVRIQGNVFRGGVAASYLSDPTVEHNHFGSNNCLIDDVDGTLQLTDNRTTGAIRVRPTTHQQAAAGGYEGGFNFGERDPIIKAYVDRFEKRRKSLRLLREAHGEELFTEIETNRRRASAETSDAGPPKDAVIVDEAIYDWGLEVLDVLIIVLLVDYEDPWVAQVEDNIAGHLQVGHNPDSRYATSTPWPEMASPDSSSRVVVVGNIADFLALNSYGHRVAAHNLVVTAYGPITVDPAPIEAPNHQV